MNPSTSAYLNVAAAVLMFVGGVGLPHTPGISDEIGMAIQSWSAWLASGIAAANAVMHWYSPPVAGPGAQP